MADGVALEAGARSPRHSATPGRFTGDTHADDRTQSDQGQAWPAGIGRAAGQPIPGRPP